MTRIGGIVLCGGQSSRMGKPKAWLPFGNEFLLQRIVRVMEEAIDSVVVVAAKERDPTPQPPPRGREGEKERKANAFDPLRFGEGGSHCEPGGVVLNLPPLPNDVTILHDELDNRGPLGGLAVGLQHFSTQSDVIFLSAVDVPFLKPAFIRGVCHSLLNHPDMEIVAPYLNGSFYPLSAAYRPAVLPLVLDHLRQNRLRMQDLMKLARTLPLNRDQLQQWDPTLESLRNVNTPDEYELALKGLSLET